MVLSVCSQSSLQVYSSASSSCTLSAISLYIFLPAFDRLVHTFWLIFSKFLFQSLVLSGNLLDLFLEQFVFLCKVTVDLLQSCQIFNTIPSEAASQLHPTAYQMPVSSLRVTPWHQHVYLLACVSQGLQVVDHINKFLISRTHVLLQPPFVFLKFLSLLPDACNKQNSCVTIQ